MKKLVDAPDRIADDMFALGGGNALGVRKILEGEALKKLVDAPDRIADDMIALGPWRKCSRGTQGAPKNSPG